MTGRKGSQTGRCQGRNHPERVRIERFLAAGASIKGAARKFDIDYHALRRHWTNHVSAEARASYVAGAGATKDQLEEFVADESLGLIDHYRIVRGALYRGFSAGLQRGPLLNIQNNVLVNPDYARAIARLVSAVSPYPEAREAVIAALRDLDAQGSSPPALADRRDERTANG